MKQSLIIMALFFSFFVSCKEKDKNDTRIMNEAKKAISEAGNANQTQLDLPFGLKFNISEEKAKSIIDSLNSKGYIVSQDFPRFSYKYPQYQLLVSHIELFFYKNMLCRLAYKFDEDISSSSSGIREWSKEYKIALDPLYNGMHFEYREPNKQIINDSNLDEISVCIRDNVVTMQKTIKYPSAIDKTETVFIFSNQPLAKNIPDYKSEREIKMGENRIKNLIEDERWAEEHKDEIQKIKDQREKSKVENSVFDGSVSIVKKYLKSNLKDPDSYESIEWGKVQLNSDGYTVWHKYRAKNSFGGYVITTQQFDIDPDGNIINVTTLQ